MRARRLGPATAPADGHRYRVETQKSSGLFVLFQKYSDRATADAVAARLRSFGANVRVIVEAAAP